LFFFFNRGDGAIDVDSEFCRRSIGDGFAVENFGERDYVIVFHACLKDELGGGKGVKRAGECRVQGIRKSNPGREVPRQISEMPMIHLDLLSPTRAVSSVVSKKKESLDFAKSKANAT